MPRIGIGLGLGLFGGTSFDADAQAFFDRVTTAGGTLTTTEKTATNQLVLDMKSAGVWTSMKAVYPMVGASAAACAQNLKSSSFTGTFTSGWTFASTGVTPNGTSAYMNTGLNISSNLSLTSTHLSFYSRTNIANSSYGSEFVENSAYNAIQVCILRIRNSVSGGNQYFTIGSDNAAGVANTNGLGLTIGIASSLTLRKVRQNNTLKATSTNLNTGILNNTNLFIGGSTLAAQYSQNQCAFASIGDAITDIQSDNLYTAVQTFNTTLSRQV
jgi:hypothetical protein